MEEETDGGVVFCGLEHDYLGWCPSSMFTLPSDLGVVTFSSHASIFLLTKYR